MPHRSGSTRAYRGRTRRGRSHGDEAQPWLAGLRGGLVCGVLQVVVRLPDGVRRPRSPPDRVVGGPGREHAVGAACEAAARLARMFPCGEGRAYVFTLRARAGAGGGAVSPRSDVGWSSAWRGRARREALPPSRCRQGKRISVNTPRLRPA